MFELFSILDFLTGFQTAAHVCGPPDCPASSFTAIGAAFATQGYYIQSDILYMLSLTRFGNWAILVYIAAVVAGGISLVMGNPPRHYIWFFMGPAIYAWLIDSQQEVRGVQWMVAGMAQDQRIVWRLAETGLRNANVTHRRDIQVSSAAPPSEPVQVSIAFLWWDELVSSTIQWMVNWTGLSSQFPGNSSETNLGVCDTAACQSYYADWHLVSPVKWDLLSSITGARMHSAALRDAFVEFMGSECGDILTSSVKKENYIAAVRADGRWLPETIFQDDFKGLTKRMVTKRIPMPRSLSSVFAETNEGSLAEFSQRFRDAAATFTSTDAITCDLYLYTIIQAFRWEAGHIFFQTMTHEYGTLHPDVLTYHLFYGWDIKDESGNVLGIQGLMEYAYNLTLIHLFKNEFEFAPDIVDTRYKQTRAAENYAEVYHKELGSRAKYGELFTWAQMVPWLQGILLYALAMGYPVAAVLIIMPGWNKVIFTWMSFWAWVKLWDLGFAVVMTMERSLWAMFGNSATSGRWNQVIHGLSQYGGIKLGCADGAGSDLATCLIPTIESGELDPSSPGAGQLIDQTWKQALDLLDKSLILGVNLDFDLSNSFYMYIMAALYMAVPAITGQLVLAARAGAAGLVGSMIGGAGQGASGAVTEGRKGVLANAIETSQSVGRRAAQSKAMRATGLAAQALQMGNAGLETNFKAGMEGQRAEGLGRLNTIGQTGVGLANSSRSVASNVLSAAARSPVEAGIAMGALAGGDQIKKHFADEISGLFQAPAAGNTAPQGASRGGQGQGGSQPGVTGAAAPMATGASPTGGILSGFGTLAKGGNSLAQSMGGIGSNILGISSDAESIAYNRDAAARSMAAADHSIASFGLQQRGSGYSAMSNRVGSQAQFEAEMAGWEWQRDFGNSKAGTASVMGMFAGNMKPGAKPFSTDAMAARGDFGESAKKAFFYPTAKGKGGMFGQVASGERQLYGNYGSKPMGAELSSRYAGSVTGELAMSGVQTVGQMHFKGSSSSSPTSNSGQAQSGTQTQGGNNAARTNPNQGTSGNGTQGGNP